MKKKSALAPVGPAILLPAFHLLIFKPAVKAD